MLCHLHVAEEIGIMNQPRHVGLEEFDAPKDFELIGHCAECKEEGSTRRVEWTGLRSLQPLDWQTWFSITFRLAERWDAHLFADWTFSDFTERFVCECNG